MGAFPYLALAFLAYTLIKAIFFTDRTPIPETSNNVHKITSAAQLQKLLSSSSSRYVVVDFYADWCPPCRAIAPVFSQLAEDHGGAGVDVKGSDSGGGGGGKLAFAKVNVDHVKDVAGAFGVSAMPTFVFFRDGLPQGVDVGGAVGARSSVVTTKDGLVERVRGADKVALETVVKALAAEVGEKKG